MYAKLSYSANVASALLIRDIVRLVTNTTPNTSMISGFANSSSFIVDATAAGWTYVNSNIDGGTLQPASNTGAYTSNTTAGTYDWWGISSPCVNTSVTKYAKLTSITAGNNSAYTGFSLTGATNISGNTVTNEGTRVYASTATGTNFQPASDTACTFYGAGTYHVIANPQHITIIKDSISIAAVWEHVATEYHQAYGITPIIQFGCTSSNTSLQSTPVYGAIYTTVGSAGPASGGTASYQYKSLNINLFNITDVGSGINYGTYSLSDPLNNTISNTYSISTNPYIFPMFKSATTGSTGINKNLVNPVLFQGHAAGIPTTYVTGVTPVYMTKGGLGAAGDTMTINGVTYTYFPCGQNVSNGSVTNSTLKNFGVLMLTY